MDYVLLILAILLIILGFLGCVLPVLPGPTLSFVGALLLHFTRFADFTLTDFLIMIIPAVIVQILDYIVPVWGTKKFGGTKYGAWGCAIGLVAGLFFLPAIGPFGLMTVLGGPFLGAYIGEKLAGQDSNKALRAAFGSFIGFLAGTMMKLASSLLITIYFVREIIQYWRN